MRATKDTKKPRGYSRCSHVLYANCKDIRENEQTCVYRLMDDCGISYIEGRRIYDYWLREITIQEACYADMSRREAERERLSDGLQDRY